MKIGLLTAFYDESKKGNEYYLARYFSQRGHEVVLYVSQWSVPRYGKVKKLTEGSSLSNVTVKRLPSFGWKSKGMLWLTGLKKVVEADQLDVIHVQEWFMPLSYQLRKERLFLTQRMQVLPSILKAYYHFFCKKFFTQARGVSALTKKAKEELLRLGVAEVELISNGVDVDLFSLGEGSGLEEQHILYAGRLDKEKGVDVLLKACKGLNNYHLTIIGSGKEEERLKGLAKDIGVRARFVSHISQEDLVKHYQRADVLVVPSRHEPFGFVMLEAMSCGTPVIGSAVGGMKDVITEETGILIPKEHSGALRHALQQIREKQKDMRAHCRKLVEEQYSWDVVGKKYLDFYKRP